MKLRFFVLFFIFFSFRTFAQEVPLPKIKKGIDLNFFISSLPHQDGFEFNPNFLITYKKSVFRLGPLINLSNGSEDYYSGGRTFNGIAFTYQIFPNGIQNRFDFFFQYDLVYYMNEITREYYSYYSSSVYSSPAKQTISVSSTNMHIGYGFRFNADQRVYITSSFGFGCKWSKDSPSYYNYDDDTSTSGIIHIGLGIKL
jgi:hypothetical protein